MDLDRSRFCVEGKDPSHFGLDSERGMSSVRTGLSNMMFLLFIFDNFSRLAEWESYLHSAFTF